MHYARACAHVYVVWIGMHICSDAFVCVSVCINACMYACVLRAHVALQAFVCMFVDIYACIICVHM
jgi:hypothetical protein